MTGTKRVLLIPGTKYPNNSEDIKELKSLMKNWCNSIHINLGEKNKK